MSAAAEPDRAREPRRHPAAASAGAAGGGTAARRAATALLGGALWLALAAVALAGGDISVSGNRFLKDGAPWVAEGVTLVGFVAPKDRLRPKYVAARARFGPALLDQVRQYGADLVRFQVSQPGLDPRSRIHDPHYRMEVLDAIALARAKGFTVIVSMQGHDIAGLRTPAGMPTNATRRAWDAIAGALGQDRGILLELFNEPALRDRTPENWETWRADMQSLIDRLRAAGARNVLLADGLRAAQFLGGAPRLRDPLDAVGYAVHPYLRGANRTEAQWDENFGRFARHHPVMATEFNARSQNRSCRKSTPREVDRLLHYLRERDIGLVIWAFDLPGVVRDGTLTSYRDLTCGPEGVGGAGEAVHKHFLDN
jgi:endoglucanase